MPPTRLVTSIMSMSGSVWRKKNEVAETSPVKL
jgi:hypothetical protein